MSVEKTLVDRVLAAMYERPETFRIDRYHLTDTKTGMVFWIANGASCAAIERPFELRFGFVQGWRFIKEVKRFKAWYANQLLATHRTMISTALKEE